MAALAVLVGLLSGSSAVRPENFVALSRLADIEEVDPELQFAEMPWTDGLKLDEVATAVGAALEVQPDEPPAAPEIALESASRVQAEGLIELAEELVKTGKPIERHMAEVGAKLDEPLTVPDQVQQLSKAQVGADDGFPDSVLFGLSAVVLFHVVLAVWMWSTSSAEKSSGTLEVMLFVLSLGLCFLLTVRRLAGDRPAASDVSVEHFDPTSVLLFGLNAVVLFHVGLAVWMWSTSSPQTSSGTLEVMLFVLGVAVIFLLSVGRFAGDWLGVESAKEVHHHEPTGVLIFCMNAVVLFHVGLAAWLRSTSSPSLASARTEALSKSPRAC